MKTKRVLLKLSGEALAGPKQTFPFDPDAMAQIVEEVKKAHDKDVEIGIVVGGGNIFRGVTGESRGMGRTPADHFGMLATIQNGLVLHDLLERKYKIETRIMTGLQVNDVAEPYIEKRARAHLEKGRVVLLVGGTGHTRCTTDYAAALRACEIGATLIAKATNTDGVYDKDPRKHEDAVLLKATTFSRCLRDQLDVMDPEAFALCRKENIPIRVFSIATVGNIAAVLNGADIGSLVSATGDSDPPADTL